MNKNTIITVTSAPEGNDSAIVIYQQIIENIDLAAVIAAANKPYDPKIEIQPAPRKRAPRSDKGQKRKAPAPRISEPEDWTA